MGFSTLIIEQAWERAGGCCECERNYHEHQSTHKCSQPLVWDKKNQPGEKGAWFAHHKIATINGGSDEDINNCEILCHECHKSAASYGIF